MIFYFLQIYNLALHVNSNGTQVEEYTDQADATANALGIDLSRTFISEHEEYNSPIPTTSIPNLSSEIHHGNGVITNGFTKPDIYTTG